MFRCRLQEEVVSFYARINFYLYRSWTWWLNEKTISCWEKGKFTHTILHILLYTSTIYWKSIYKFYCTYFFSFALYSFYFAHINLKLISINEFNPAVVGELKQLRQENKDMREKLMRLDISEFERIERELKDEKSLSLSYHNKLIETRESKMKLKMRLVCNNNNNNNLIPSFSMISKGLSIPTTE